MGTQDNYLHVFLAWVFAFAAYVLAFGQPGWLRLPDWKSWWSSNRRLGLALAAITLAAFVLRLWQLDSIPFVLSGDEASIGLSGVYVVEGEIRNPFSTGWYSVPTMNFFLLSLPLHLFGQTVFAIRLPAALLGAITIPLVFVLVRRLADERFALVTAALLAVYHYHIHFSRLAANMAFDPLFAVLVLYFLHRALERNARMDWIWAGAFCGLVFYFYAGARFVPLLAAAVLGYSLLSDGWGSLRRNWRGMLLMAGAFLVVAAPMLQYAIRFPDDFNARVNQVGIIQSGWLARETEITGKTVAEILLDQFRRAVLAFNYYPDRTVWYGLRQPLLDPLFGVLFLLGLGFATLRAFIPPSNKSLFLMAAWWWGAVLAGGFLTENPPSSMRLVTTAVPVCFLITLAISQLLSLARRAHRAVPMNAMMAAAVLLFAGISLKMYFYDFTPQRLAGGPRAELATVLAPRLRELAAGHQIYFVGAPWMYWNFTTNPFLVPAATVQDIEEPIAAPLKPGMLPAGRGAAFVVLPERRAELPFILETFPQAAVYEIETDSAWRVSATLVVVPAQDG